MRKRVKYWIVGGAVSVLISGCAPSGVTPAGGDTSATNRVLLAKLGGTGGGAQGFVQLEDQGGHRQLTVDITGGTPGQTFDISLNGMAVLSVTLDESGNAHLQFDSQPDQSNESPLPTEFPDAGPGDTVHVGDMSGNFEEHHDGEADHHEDGEMEDDDDGNTHNANNGNVDDSEDGDADHADDGGVDNVDEDDASNSDNSATDDVDDASTGNNADDRDERAP